MCHTKFLAHNKFVVVCDARGAARWVWTGSTNLTPSGLCTQANNGVLIDDPTVATRFWHQLELLAAAGDASPKSLAEENSTPTTATVDKAGLRVWFTRTLKQVDLEDGRALIGRAQQGVLFLMFQTGATASLLEAILQRRSEPDFFVHGVMTRAPSTGKSSGPKPRSHEEAIARQIGFVHKSERTRYAPDLLLPFALEKPSERWLAEFVKKNGAHAVIHSKVIVLDPFGLRPVVMTGSHNLGRTASSKNDENLVVVENSAALAAAYATNIIAIYDNFRWRFRVAQGTSWKGLADGDGWQRRYLDGSVPEFRFFAGTG
jgi:phosphatidylserine/phosphatidylglycerophosphate/cardiolipin synthase-like enzyme